MLQFLWMMLDSMQISNYILYINIYLPENAKKILLLLADTNLYFVNNFIGKVFEIETNSKAESDYVVERTKPPEKFEILGITALYLTNAGSSIGMIALLFLICGINQLLDKRKHKYFKNKYVLLIFEKQQKLITIPYILRTISVLLMGLSLAICLQLRSISTLNTFYYYHFLLAFISPLGIFLYCKHLFEISNNENTVFQVEEYMKYYSALFSEVNMGSLIGRNQFLAFCIKKILLNILIIGFYDFPYILLSILIVEHLLELVLVAKFDLFLTKPINYFIRFSEFVLLLSFCCMLVTKIYFDVVILSYKIIPENNLFVFDLMGWILIGLVFSLLAFFFCIANWSMFLALKKIFRKMSGSLDSSTKLKKSSRSLHDSTKDIIHLGKEDF